MKKRIIAIACLILIAIFIAGKPDIVTRIGWGLYPYFYPQQTCFLKNGTKVYSGKECLLDKSKIYAERTIGAFYDGSNFGEVKKTCREFCQNDNKCVRYVVGWPLEIYDSSVFSEPPGTFQCTLLGSKPRGYYKKTN